MSERREQRPDGVILCGGRGSRMGGVDKGLMNIGGTPAVAIAAALLKPLCGEIFINANRNLKRYEELSLGTLITDLRENYPGPLGGLEATAPHLRSDRVLVLPCDMPRLGPAVPEKLVETLDTYASLDVVYARAGSDNHYLVAAIRQRVFAALPPLLDAGQGAVRGWYGELRSEAVQFPDAMAGDFLNLNHARAATDNPVSR